MAAQRVAERADDLGLTGALRPARAHGIAMVAVAQAVVGLSLGAAPWWTFPALVPAYLLLVRPTRRNLAGEVAVRAARAARPDLHPWRQASRRGLTPASAGLAVAVYGTTALCAIDKDFAWQLLDPMPRHLRPRAAPGDGADGADGGCDDGDGGE